MKTPYAASLLAIAWLAGTAPAALAQAAPATNAPAAQPTAADLKLKALYDAEWTWRQKEFARLPRQRPDGRRRRRSSAQRDRRRPAAPLCLLERHSQTARPDPPTRNLSHEEYINKAVFKTSVWENATKIKYKTYEAPFNSDTFFWTGLNPRTPFSSADNYRRYLGRMKDIPRYFDEQIANMQAGLKRGYTVPRVSIEGRDKTIEPFLAAGADNPFYKAFAAMPDTIPADQRQAMQAQAQALIRDAIAPSYQKLLTFMRGEYMPKARKTIDAYSLPDGKAFYQDQIREYTTLDLTPQQIHEIGLKEVARIDADMKKTMADAKFQGSFAEFLEFMRTDPQFYAKTPRELLSYSAYVTKKMDGKLKDTFNNLPRYRFTILPVPDEIAPIYTSGRGGLESCLMNTYDLPSRPLYNLTALTLHECNPGHSFQAAYALEAPNRPAFRGQTYFSGYGEGWGLYTEWLGTKLGMYETPYEEFGRETFEMWRAVRLVIDTGMHSMGWTRQQAIDYMASHTALAKLDITNEVDRYIAWPAQALAYKLGELSIRKMRAKAEAELGRQVRSAPVPRHAAHHGVGAAAGDGGGA